MPSGLIAPSRSAWVRSYGPQAKLRRRLAIEQVPGGKARATCRRGGWLSSEARATAPPKRMSRRLPGGSSAILANGVPGSDGLRLRLRLFRLLLDRLLGVDRQLQHGGDLAFAQAGHQHDLAAREFERVVVVMRILQVDLAETRDLLGDPPARQQAEGVHAGYFLLEGELCAGHQADGDIRLADRREAPRDGVGEFCGDQLVPDLGRAA